MRSPINPFIHQWIQYEEDYIRVDMRVANKPTVRVDVIRGTVMLDAWAFYYMALYLFGNCPFRFLVPIGIQTQRAHGRSRFLVITMIIAGMIVVYRCPESGELPDLLGQLHTIFQVQYYGHNLSELREYYNDNWDNAQNNTNPPQFFEITHSINIATEYEAMAAAYDQTLLLGIGVARYRLTFDPSRASTGTWADWPLTRDQVMHAVAEVVILHNMVTDRQQLDFP